jgi:exodeoxyribonuclease V alpha subunit
VLNPPGSHKVERFHGGTCFRVGDKVLQLRNNYDKEVFNGDSGTILGISLEEQTVTVRLDDERRVSYEFSELDELMLAYALSIHKAQGSEYPVCVIPLAMEQYLLLERQLVYTALTRARQLVVLVGSKRALALAVRNGPALSAASVQAPGGSAPLRTLATTLTRGWTGRSTGLAIRLRQLAPTGEASPARF